MRFVAFFALALAVVLAVDFALYEGRLRRQTLAQVEQTNDLVRNVVLFRAGR
jgi:hypothetical protein